MAFFSQSNILIKNKFDQISILMKDGVFFHMLAHLLSVFPLTNNKTF
jgi:hypothetical protein